MEDSTLFLLTLDNDVHQNGINKSMGNFVIEQNYRTLLTIINPKPKKPHKIS
jgi:hypothetical protein